MRRGRLVPGVIAAVLSLLVGCVWLVPGMLDWSRYRDGIAALAAQRLGRPVHIGGAVTLQLLPQPILTAADIAIEDAGDGIFLQARALRLRVALGPLLAGVVDARELTLQGADLRLPWPPQAGAFAQRPPSWISGVRASVEDSRLQVGNLALTDIDATLATDPETGTLSAAGIGQSGTRVWQFTARLARPGGDGGAGLDVSLDGQGPLRDTGGTFSGQIGANGALAGRVAGRGPDLSQLMAAPTLAWRGDGRLSAAGGLAIADELALEIGGAPARGAVALRVEPSARLDLAIAAGRLDLDAWLPALLARNPANVRADIPTGIDLSAEAATLAGGTLRHLRAAADVGPGTILLREMTATLPGEAQLTMSGQVEGTVQPRFDGAIRLSAPDLRTTLRWLQPVLPPGLDMVPSAVGRTAALSAHVNAAAGQALVSDLRGTIDGSRITGSVSVSPMNRPAATPRLSVTVALALDKVALDGWLPDPRVLARADMALSSLRSLDSDLRLQVGHADWGATSLGAVALEVQSDAGRVVLRRLEAEPLGTKLAVSGQVAESGRVTDGRLEMTAPDLSVLQPLIAELPGEVSGLRALSRGSGSLVIQAVGPPDALAVRLQVDVSDLRLEVAPTVNLQTRRWSGPVTLHHPGAPRFLETLGYGGTVSWLGDGSLSLVGQVVAAPGRIELQSGTLSAGALRMSGRLLLEGTHVTGQVVAETLPLPSFYPRSPDPLPLDWLNVGQADVRVEAAQILIGLSPVLQAASTDLSLSGGILSLYRFTGRFAGGQVSGAAVVDAASSPPHVSLQVAGNGLGISGNIFDTVVDLVAGTGDFRADLSASGHSANALLSTLSGRATIGIKNGVATGFDLPALGASLILPTIHDITEAVRGSLLSGNTGFTALDSSLAFSRGVAVIAAGLESAGGKAALAGSLDLLAGATDLQITLQPTIDGPALKLAIAGRPAELKRMPELAGLARWLADRPSPVPP